MPPCPGMKLTSRAPRNRTLTCSEDEAGALSKSIMRLQSKVTQRDIERRVIGGDIFDVANFLPTSFVDLLILDPPYNLSKNFNGNAFRQMEEREYEAWFRALVRLLISMLKPASTIYVCSEWKTSKLILPILEEHFFVRNRITWEREKGRGAKTNWKNSAEDIWFCTLSQDYYFDVESVKLKRRVLAPYREEGRPKDWKQESAGKFRLTYPSNLWTDLTVPFWSMPENTDHPTQKPEKLFAKLILASSRTNDFVFDPFLGSGTTAVVAEKLNRLWCGVDVNTEYLCWAQKRLRTASLDPTIQGYRDGVFWERNTVPIHRRKSSENQGRFFE